MAKTLEKTKKHTKKTKIRRLYEARHFPQIFVYCFCSFLVFSRLLLLSVKNQKKHRENQKNKKKQKKRKNTKKNQKKQKKQRLGDYMRPDISLKSLVFFGFFGFFVFFGFLEVFLVFDQK